MGAQLLDIVDKIPSSVVLEARKGEAFATTSLVEEDDPVEGGIEERSVIGIDADAGPAMEKEDRFSFGIATLFKIETMAPIDREISGPIGLDKGIEGAQIFCSQYGTNSEENDEDSFHDA